jgi:hypothetical protein
MLTEDSKKILIKFGHGMGDAVQLTVVLQHLRKYHPNWTIDIITFYGKHSVFEYLCDNLYISGDKEKVDEANYDEVFDLGWWEPRESSGDHPCTKAEKCLKDVFDLPIDKNLCSYKMIFQTNDKLIEEYLDSICKTKDKVDGKWPVVVIHYQGNTAVAYKNLDHSTIHKLCEAIIKLGFVPLILDWDQRSYIPDNKRVFCPDSGCFIWKDKNIGNAQTIATLVDNCLLFIGIDSGPQKVASCTSTEVVSVWTKHHPVNYFGLNKNVHHLVPLEHKNYIKSDDKDICANFFRKNYDFHAYSNLDLELIAIVYNILRKEDKIYNFTNLQDVINEYIKPSQDNLELLELKKSSLTNKMFVYERCGYDKRDMQLLPNGAVGHGAAGMEKKWDFIFRENVPTLIVKSDSDSITFEAQQDHEGIWHGRWKSYEKMPIILAPKDLSKIKKHYSDFTILIQGPLNKISINNIKNYSDFGKIIVSCWTNDNLSLLSDVYQDILIVKSSYPLEDINNKNNMGKQIISTINGLKYCDTKYCIKVRSDESFSDLTFLVNKVLENSDKIISTNNGFNDRPYHPSDHILAGSTRTLRDGFKNALSIIKKEGENPIPELPICPERIICFGILKAKNVTPNIKNWVSNMKVHFDLVQMSTLGDIFWSCNSRGFTSNKDNYNSFAKREKDKTITVMEELGTKTIIE